MYLFVYEGFHGGSDRRKRSEALIGRALDALAAETGVEFPGMSRQICRTEKGKPYFKEIPVAFSVSHTDDLWVCLMSPGISQVGVDIQKIKTTRMDKVAARYFSADEKNAVAQCGEEMFFRIWTRKEAYAKFTGMGLSKELNEISTMDSDEVYFIDLDIKAGVKGSCCVKEKGELCLRMI